MMLKDANRFCWWLWARGAEGRPVGLLDGWGLLSQRFDGSADAHHGFILVGCVYNVKEAEVAAEVNTMVEGKRSSGGAKERKM